jgi:hypothetical protein
MLTSSNFITKDSQDVIEKYPTIPVITISNTNRDSQLLPIMFNSKAVELFNPDNSDGNCKVIVGRDFILDNGDDSVKYDIVIGVTEEDRIKTVDNTLSSCLLYFNTGKLYSKKFIEVIRKHLLNTNDQLKFSSSSIIELKLIPIDGIDKVFTMELITENQEENLPQEESLNQEELIEEVDVNPHIVDHNGMTI